MRASPVRRLMLSVEFSCAKCGCRQRCSFPDGIAARPVACTDGCRGRSFTPILATADTVAWQRIRLQVGHTHSQGGYSKQVLQGNLQRGNGMMQRSAILQTECALKQLIRTDCAGLEATGDRGSRENVYTRD